MFPFLIPLLGAGAGALINKKNPLQGALMGGALGAGGAGLAGGLLGGAAGTGGWATAAEGLAAQEAGLGLTGSMGWGGATTGLQGLLNSAGAGGGLLDTAGNAFKTASSIKSMMPEDPPIQPAPAFSSGGGNGSMQGMYQNLQSQRMKQRDFDDQMRAERAKRLKMFG